MVVLLMANIANTVAEFARRGRVAGHLRRSRCLTVPVVAVAIWGLVLFASYRAARARVPAGEVVFLAYPIAAVLATEDWGPVFNALVTPDVAALDSRSLLLLVAVVGTTITPYMQFYLQSAVAEKGIGEEELPLEQADAVAGSVWTNVIAIFIVVATAAAVGLGGGAVITSAADAARALEPVAGRFAEALFGIGLFGASVLAATIMPLSTAFVICEAFGWESGVGKRFSDAPIFFGIYTFVLALGAIAVLLVPEGRPRRGHRGQPEPPGPAAADRAGVHRAAGQRPAPDGRPRQRPPRERAGLGRGRGRGGAERGPARHGAARRARRQRRLSERSAWPGLA